MNQNNGNKTASNRIDPYTWHPVYKELVKVIGLESTLLLFQEYRGSQLHFPMRLVDPANLPQIIQDEYNGHNLRELAKYYGYSERHLRRILTSIEKNTDDRLMEQELPYLLDIRKKSESKDERK